MTARRYAVARLRNPGTGPWYDVHAAGCRDLHVRGKYDPDQTTVSAFPSVDSVIRHVYPPAGFDYDGTDLNQLAEYAVDFRVHACAHLLPEHDPEGNQP